MHVSYYSLEISLQVDKNITVKQLKDMLVDHVGAPSYAFEVITYLIVLFLSAYIMIICL